MFHYIRNKLTQAQIIAMGYFSGNYRRDASADAACGYKKGEMATPLTALFTATSATCVTGLVVVDTASYWSVFRDSVSSPAPRFRWADWALRTIGVLSPCS